MQAATLIRIVSLMALTQARPLLHSNFMLWNYVPYLQQHQQQQQQQQLYMMQQASMQMMQTVSMPHPMQYPSFEMYFNHAIPMTNNMPYIEEVQFQMPMAQSNPPATTTKATTTPRPRPTTTTKSRPPSPAARPIKPQTSVKQSTPQVSSVLKSQLSKGIFEMARHIQANNISENSHHQTGKFNVFSPINVAAVLSLLEFGARKQTQQELQHTLGFDKLQPLERRPLDRHYALGQMLESMLYPAAQGTQINMANGIFIQTGYSLRQDYRTSVETIYQSQISSLDFQQQPAVATKFINDWVQLQTNGKIANILGDGIDRNTRMMVASAVYFKSLWKSSFIAEATSKRPFYPNGKDGQRIMVDTMGNSGEFMYYQSKDYDCSIMALPFKDETTAMYIILPKKSNEAKLRKLQTTLTADVMEDMISKMKLRTSIITLPKIHLSDTLDLKDVLSQLKVRNVFESISDFSGISEHNLLSLDGFVHKIDLTINEAGTEGAAAIATSQSRRAPDIEFRVDSPFMFFVRHEETKLPIFYGFVIEPVNGS